MLLIGDKDVDFINIEDEDDNNDYFDILPNDFSFNPKKSTPNIGSLVYSYQQGLLKIPDFQREFVWSIQQASLFIETLLLDLPRPNIFFYRDEEYNNYIIDGQQRLKSIFCFLGILSEKDIPKKDKSFLNFQLTGLSSRSPWHNKTYNAFSEADKRKLNERELDIVTIQINNDHEKKVVYHIFKRLNTGGTKLTEQEIRNCIYAGKFNTFLHKLAENPTWQKLITLDKPQGRLKDVELILRFFALYDDLLSYNKPMKDFLSNYMMKKSKITEEELQTKRNLFEATIDSIHKHLTEYPQPFHTKNQINSSVCDSIMVCFAKNLNNIPKDIEDRYINLTKHNGDYDTYVSNSSDSKNSVYKRIQIAEKILFPPKSISQNNAENTHRLKLYSLLIRGAKKFDLNNNFEYTQLPTRQDNVSFAVKVRGNDMSPQINNKDILLIRSTNNPKNGDIIMCQINNITMVRKILYSNKNLFLKLGSSNHNMIKITSENHQDFKCIGIVTEVINGETIK